MALKSNHSLKRYYSISEVAKMFNVSSSLIRFWETEFDFLKPSKNSKGNRRFTKNNIDQFKIIYHLVKVKGFTLKGAKKEIKEQKEHLMQKEKTLERMKKLRFFLDELKAEL